MNSIELRHAIRHPYDRARMHYRHWRRTRNWGRRVENGGVMGTIVPCPTCDGTGELHQPDEHPVYSQRPPAIPVEPTLHGTRPVVGRRAADDTTKQEMTDGV